MCNQPTIREAGILLQDRTTVDIPFYIINFCKISTKDLFFLKYYEEQSAFKDLSEPKSRTAHFTTNILQSCKTWIQGWKKYSKVCMFVCLDADVNKYN